MKPPSTPAAILNIEEAMVLVERAQNDLDRAAQKLSPICFGSDLSDKAFALRQAVNKFWYRLDTAAKSRPGMRLDREGDLFAVLGAAVPTADGGA